MSEFIPNEQEDLPKGAEQRAEVLDEASFFTVGQEVTVHRTGANGEPGLETGWKVEWVNEDEGTVKVWAPDKSAYKTYSIQKLMSLQPQPSEAHVAEAVSFEITPGADVARQLVAIEPAQPLAPEFLPEARVEVAGDMGDEALEEVGIEDPSESSVIEAETANKTGEGVSRDELERVYARGVDGIREELTSELNVLAKKLEDGEGDILQSRRLIVSRVLDDAANLEKTVRNMDNYSQEALRTLLVRTVDELHSTRGALLRHSADSIRGVAHSIDVYKRDIVKDQTHAEEHDQAFIGNSAALGIDVGEPRDATVLVHEVANELDEVTSESRRYILRFADVIEGPVNEGIKRAIGQLEEIKDQSYRGQISPDEIMNVVRQLKATVDEKSEVDGSLQYANRGVQDASESVRRTITRLRQNG